MGLAVLLAAFGGLSFASLVVGLLSKAIDGPARGRVDLIHLDAQPVAFWAMAFFYLVLTVMLMTGAYRLIKGKAPSGDKGGCE